MRIKEKLLLASVAVLALGAASASAWADEIKNPIAVLAGLDKITGRVITFDAAINETVQFGSLQIKPRVCYTKPPTEAPQTVSFLQVDNVNANHKYKRIFSGWMFAASPGLNGVEHPVYDVWLLNCKGGTKVIASAPDDSTQAKPALFEPDSAAKPIAETAPAKSGFAAAPPNAAPQLRGARGMAPPFTGAPIEVGAAPGEEGPAAVQPPGPLAPALRPQRRPMRKFYPSEDQPDDRNPY